MELTMNVSNTQSKALYKAAGGMAILIEAAGLTDAITSMGTTAQDNRIIQIMEWFTLFQTSRFEAFSRLGVINILTLSFGIPIYLAFHQAFRKERPSLAAFAAILFFIGTAIYLSSNTVFALYAVSQQYAIATAAQSGIGHKSLWNCYFPLLLVKQQEYLPVGAGQEMCKDTFPIRLI